MVEVTTQTMEMQVKTHWSQEGQLKIRSKANNTINPKELKEMDRHHTNLIQQIRTV